MSAEPVVVFRSYDPVAIDLAEAQLRSAGVPYVRGARGNAALLGAGNSIVEQLLEVQAEHAAEASALLATQVKSDDTEPKEAPSSRKTAFIAAGVCW